MKEINDLKKSVRDHVEKLEKKGLYLEQIYLEYTRQEDFASSPPLQRPAKREVVVKLSSKIDTQKPVWF